MNTERKQIIEFGKFRLDAGQKILWHEQEEVAMPLKELEVLCLLVENQGKLVSKNEILDKIWADSFAGENNLSRHIYLLRKTLRGFGADGLIENVPRRGYRFTGEAHELSNGEIVVEKHTRTQTLIEFEEEALETRKLNGFYRRISASPVLRVAAMGLLLVLASAFAFFGYQKWNAKTSASAIKSIAVLPFKSLTADNEEKVLANGIREKTISSLGGLKSLKILSVELSETEIQNLSNFDAVLVGTVQQSEDKVRVSLRLLQTSDAEQIWAGNFNELRTDIFELQDKISDEISKTLSVNLSKQEREIVFRRETQNPQAYEQYLQGLYFLNQRGDNYYDSLKKARTFFENAIKLDPSFAEAYVGLADTINLQTDSNSKLDSGYDEGYKKSKELISQALAINPNLPEAYSAIGWVQYRYELNFAEAEKSFLKALELNPHQPNVYLWLSTVYNITGNSEKSISYAEKAVELEPTFSKALGNLSITYAYNRKCEKAVELFPRISQYMTNQGNRLQQEGDVLSICGRCEEAVPVLQEAKKLFPTGRVVASNLGYCYAKMNQLEKAREELKVLDIEPVTGFGVYGKILIYDALGETEKAIDIFSDLYKTKDARKLRFLYDPRLEGFRNNPQVKEMTKDLKLN